MFLKYFCILTIALVATCGVVNAVSPQVDNYGNPKEFTDFGNGVLYIPNAQYFGWSSNKPVETFGERLVTYISDNPNCHIVSITPVEESYGDTAGFYVIVKSDYNDLIYRYDPNHTVLYNTTLPFAVKGSDIVVY